MPIQLATTTTATSAKTTVTTESVSLEEALKHGAAHHERGPWRFNLKKHNKARRFETARPRFDDEGLPLLDDNGEAILEWSPCSEEEARKAWDQRGWILD